MRSDSCLPPKDLQRGAVLTHAEPIVYLTLESDDVREGASPELMCYLSDGGVPGWAELHRRVKNAHRRSSAMKRFSMACRVFRRHLHHVGIIGAPFGKGQVREPLGALFILFFLPLLILCLNAILGARKFGLEIMQSVLWQPKDGVQLGPDVIREAGLVKKLQFQGTTDPGLAI